MAEYDDFSDVIEDGGIMLPPVHPGDVLKTEFLDALNMPEEALAQALRIPEETVYGLVRWRRPLTTDLAMRLARFFGTSAELWLGLQMGYDLDVSRRPPASMIEAEITPFSALAA